MLTNTIFDVVPRECYPLAKELVHSLPNWERAPLQDWQREELLHGFSQLIKAAKNRADNFAPTSPENARIRAELCAVGNQMLSQVLAANISPSAAPAPVIGPGWREAGAAAGTLLGLGVRGFCEISTGLVLGIFRGIFAAKSPNNKPQAQEFDSKPANMPINSQRPALHVRVEVDVVQ